IDDDETLSSNWLEDMLAQIDKTKADIVSGPVEIILPPEAPKSLKYAYQFRPRDSYELAKRLPMGNLFFTRKLLETNLWFDMRFNHSGGEDMDFTYRAYKLGLTLMRVPKGRVYEELVPEKRSLFAFFKRQCRVFRVHYREKYPVMNIYFLMQVLLIPFELCFIVLLSPISLFSGKYKVKCLKSIARLTGRLTSRLSITEKAYG
ncbi:MAG: glycosyltransferase family 2 protein, partial [Pseudomonadota bacterium]